jgi:hypothetical protein
VSVEIKHQNDHIQEQNGQIKHQNDHIQEQNGRIQCQNHEIHEGVRETRDLVHRTLLQIRTSEAILRRAIFEATEIDCPTCFIILPRKVDAVKSSTGVRCGVRDVLVEYVEGLDRVCSEINNVCAATSQEDANGGNLPRDDAHTTTACNNDNCNNDNCNNTHAATHEPEHSSGGDTHTSTDMDVHVPGGRYLRTLRNGFESFVAGRLFQESMWLYLVDEYTGLPVTRPGDPTYPIELKTRKFLPLMNVSIAAMYAHNGAAGIAQLFGVPVPRLPKGMVRMAENIRNSVVNSVAQFDCLSLSLSPACAVGEGSVVHGRRDDVNGGIGINGGGSSVNCAINMNRGSDGSSANKKARGASLREFREFLSEKDQKKGFAGLLRVMTSCGAVVWTCVPECHLEGVRVRDATSSCGARLRGELQCVGSASKPCYAGTGHQAEADCHLGGAHVCSSSHVNEARVKVGHVQHGLSCSDAKCGTCMQCQSCKRAACDSKGLSCNDAKCDRHEDDEYVCVNVEDAQAAGAERDGKLVTARDTPCVDGVNKHNSDSESDFTAGSRIEKRAGANGRQMDMTNDTIINDDYAATQKSIAEDMQMLLLHDEAMHASNDDVSAVNRTERHMRVHLSDDVRAVGHAVHDVRRDIQRLKLEMKLPLEFKVKKRVQRTPGIRATRKLTIEQRDGEPVLVNRTPRGSERNVLRVCDVERLTAAGALNIAFRCACV